MAAEGEEVEKRAEAQPEEEGGCPVRMSAGIKCGRPIYPAPQGVDKVPVCLMHSADPLKDKAKFQSEFERILDHAGKGIADFTRFVFPSADYAGRTFKARGVFDEATFTQKADFRGANFTQEADFSGAIFTQGARFNHATFTQDADFPDAIFTQEADFSYAIFTQEAYFRDAIFTQEARFNDATFTQDADFRRATFTQEADFRWATFTQDADFPDAIFTQEADFHWATFTQEADFRDATFTQDADFRDATFTQEANFIGATFTQQARFIGATFTQEARFSYATFTQQADFSEATFTQQARFIGAIFTDKAYFHRTKFWGRVNGQITGQVDFRGAKFLSAAEFRETKFRTDGKEVGAIFAQAEFEKPEKVVFYKTNLRQVLFHNCDVSRFVFSNVEWRRRTGNQKRMLFEEVVSPPEAPLLEALMPEPGSGDERNYGLIAETYQQLKRNFDERRDYWTAGDWHWGELEMKRLAAPRPRGVPRQLDRFPRLKEASEKVMGAYNRFRRWRHRKLGLAAWYKYASDYGESYWRPLLWLGFVLAVFTLAYPLAGLESARSSHSPISWRGIGQWMAERGYSGWSVLEFWQAGLLMALSVMLLQRDLPYAPVNACGWWLRLLETFLSVVLLPLFLLAVRRQFRR